MRARAQFALIVDTGSSNLAVAGDAITAVSNTYDPALSSTARDNGTQILLSYGIGSWAGTLYTDCVTVDTFMPLNVSECPFVVMDMQNSFFISSSAFEGILGMAYQALAQNSIPPFFDLLVRREGISNVFAIQFCESSGQLWLGGSDSTYYTGGLLYAPIAQALYYAVTVVDVAYGGASLGLSTSQLSPSSGLPIVDSGTTFLYLNNVAFSALTQAILDTYPYLDPAWFGGSLCVNDPSYSPSVISAAITISIQLAGGSGNVYVLSVPSTQYIVQYGCGYAFAVSQTSIIIIGQNALIGQYVVFDRTNSRVGFAPGQASLCGNVDRTIQSSLMEGAFVRPARRCGRCVVKAMVVAPMRCGVMMVMVSRYSPIGSIFRRRRSLHLAPCRHRHPHWPNAC